MSKPKKKKNKETSVDIPSPFIPSEEPLAMRKPKTVHRATANRNFDQMKAGDSVLINPNDGYWINQLSANNIQVTSEVL